MPAPVSPISNDAEWDWVIGLSDFEGSESACDPNSTASLAPAHVQSDSGISMPEDEGDQAGYPPDSESNNFKPGLPSGSESSPSSDVLAEKSLSKASPSPSSTTTTEVQKAISTQRRRKVILFSLQFHLPSVVTTFLLFGLYLAGFQWRAGSNQLTLLLFAAKLHEALILASLSDILFHRIRYNLLTSRGVSFGVVTSPFQLNDATFLLRRPFLASAGLLSSSLSELVTIGLVLLTAILALLAAPSSGILMLPKYDWWPLPDSSSDLQTFRDSQRSNPDNVVISAGFEDLFPTYVDESYRPNPYRDNRLSLQAFSDRFQHLLSGLDQIQALPGSQFSTNLTVVDGAAVDLFGIGYSEQWQEGHCPWADPYRPSDYRCDSIVAYSSSPLAIVTQDLFSANQRWRATSRDSIKIRSVALDQAGDRMVWRQPRVLLQCQYIAPERTAHFPSGGIFPAANATINAKDIQSVSSAWNPSAATFADVRYLPFDISTSFIFQPNSSESNEKYLCLMDARWIESDVWMTTPASAIVQSGSRLDPSDDATWAVPTDSSGIRITPGWGNSLNAKLSVSPPLPQPDSHGSPPFEYLRDYCSRRSNDARTLRKCQVLAYATFLTDSLRRIQTKFDIASLSDYLDPSRTISRRQQGNTTPVAVTRTETELYHQVHCYKLEGTLPRLAFAVLLIHVMLVYAHLFMAIGGDGWYSRAWSEFGELLALALLTKPTELLRNSGGGIKKWDTWRLRSYIRETEPGKIRFVLVEQDVARRGADEATGLTVPPESSREYE